MTEILADWFKNPAFWVILLILGGAWIVLRRMRMRLGILRAFYMAVSVWAAFVVAGQLVDINVFGDLRHWIGNAIVMAAILGPVVLLSLVLPAATAPSLLIVAGTFGALMGAVLFPFVTLHTICALGIDCL